MTNGGFRSDGRRHVGPAIMDNEPERCRVNELIEAVPATYVIAASLFETRIVRRT